MWGDNALISKQNI